MKKTRDRPPIWRFLIVFSVLLGVVVGLAALAASAEPANASAASADSHRRAPVAEVRTAH
jgi:hypothetical protein